MMTPRSCALRQEIQDRPCPMATDVDHFLARKAPCFALLRRDGSLSLPFTRRLVGVAGRKEAERARPRRTYLKARRGGDCLGKWSSTPKRWLAPASFAPHRAAPPAQGSRHRHGCGKRYPKVWPCWKKPRATPSSRPHRAPPSCRLAGGQKEPLRGGCSLLWHALGSHGPHGLCPEGGDGCSPLAQDGGHPSRVWRGRRILRNAGF